ncbi:MAG: hypothetical protein C0596_13255 [Marinilabiliales bacterium]|nr:MAG: hypothetical protein C0596_13255 [Marinilabiliales bacterium]
MKCKISILVGIFVVIGLILNAQEDTTKNWKTGGVLSFNASQVSFTNWAAGGENSLSGNSFVNLFANYKKNKMTWDNTLDLGFGMMKQGFGDESVYYKTDDKIDFSSKYGQYAFEHFYYTGLVSFKSQFTEGYKKATDTVRISNFLAPAYINISLGMDYKPNDNFTLFVSPFSGKITYVTDTMLSNAGAYGVTPGEIVRYEFGGYIKAQFKCNLADNISYTTKLDLFSNYLKKPQNIDVNWENLVTFKINGWFAANIHLTMMYDDDTKIDIDRDGDGVYDGKGARPQIKQLFGIGITYKF